MQRHHSWYTAPRLIKQSHPIQCVTLPSGMSNQDASHPDDSAAPSSHDAAHDDQAAVQAARVTDLLERAAAGNQSAWRDLVGLYAPRVFAMAQSRCRNAHIAEDITQGVFATLCAKLGTGEYREQGKFEAWIFRVTMNRVRDLARKATRTTRIFGNRIEVDDNLDAMSQTQNQFNDKLQHLRDALAQLPDNDREVIELRHHGGLSFKQIADLLGEPLGTLLARHHRALQKLREILEPQANADNTAASRALSPMKGVVSSSSAPRPPPTG